MLASAANNSCRKGLGDTKRHVMIHCSQRLERDAFLLVLPRVEVSNPLTTLITSMTPEELTSKSVGIFGWVRQSRTCVDLHSELHQELLG